MYPPPPGPRVTYARRQTNHLLHAALCIPTFGMWLFVWPCRWAWNRFGPRIKTIHKY